MHIALLHTFAQCFFYDAMDRCMVNNNNNVLKSMDEPDIKLFEYPSAAPNAKRTL